MRNDTNHWRMSFSSNDRVQIFNISYMNPTLVIKNCLKAIYKPNVEKNGKLSVAIAPVEK